MKLFSLYLPRYKITSVHGADKAPGWINPCRKNQTWIMEGAARRKTGEEIEREHQEDQHCHRLGWMILEGFSSLNNSSNNGGEKPNQTHPEMQILLWSFVFWDHSEIGIYTLNLWFLAHELSCCQTQQFLPASALK